MKIKMSQKPFYGFVGNEKKPICVLYDVGNKLSNFTKNDPESFNFEVGDILLSHSKFGPELIVEPFKNFKSACDWAKIALGVTRFGVKLSGKRNSL